MQIEAIMNSLILKNVIKENSSQNIQELISGILSKPQIEYISAVMHNDKYEFLSKNDYVKIEYDDSGLNYDLLDQLHDKGLYDGKYIYGRIINSDDWGEDFNPYHYNMKVNLFLLDDDLKLFYCEEKINTYKLIKIKKQNIKYYQYGADITTTSRE
jgi:hypothetical protein